MDEPDLLHIKEVKRFPLQPGNHNNFINNKLIKNKNRSFILLINIFLFRVHSKFNNVFNI
jgi:hypothetical protein